MIISHKKKFIFIHIQRTGGSSIISALKLRLGSDIEIIAQHGNARSQEKSLLEKYNDYYKFTFVRNPWDRILSWYFLVMKNANHNSDVLANKYESFIENDSAFEAGDPYFHYNQLDYITDQNGNLLIDKCYRFENYFNDFKQMCRDLDLPNGSVPHLNSTMLSNYQEHYTNISKSLVAQKALKDIEAFNYEF